MGGSLLPPDLRTWTSGPEKLRKISELERQSDAPASKASKRKTITTTTLSYIHISTKRGLDSKVDIWLHSISEAVDKL
jgi:hypothetical protein